MKVIVHLEVTDEQRNALARMIDGKEIKRLATRSEFNTFVKGHVDSLTNGSECATCEGLRVALECADAELARARVGLEEKRAPAATQDVTACGPAPVHPLLRPVQEAKTRSEIENERSDSENIERHGTGIESDRTPISRALEAVNTAMLSLGRVRHHAESCGFTGSINRLLDDICNVRAEMVDEYARQRFEREL